MKTLEQFDQPSDVDGPSLAFGGDMRELLPNYKEIPDDFKRRHPNCEIVSTWFFCGLPKGTDFVPRDGIDPAKALRHLKAIMSSFQPKHEHKTAGVAYLMSRWFSEVKIPESADQ